MGGTFAATTTTSNLTTLQIVTITQFNTQLTEGHFPAYYTNSTLLLFFISNDFIRFIVVARDAYLPNLPTTDIAITAGHH